MIWQLSPRWYKPSGWYWYWHAKTWDEHYKIHSHFAGFGPLQFHWYSK